MTKLLFIISLLGLCLGCVNTPNGQRSALALNETSILEARPGNIRLALQTNDVQDFKPTPLELVLFDENKTAVFDESLETRIIASGTEPGHELPPARDGQNWFILALSEQGVVELVRAQAIYRNMKSAGEKGSMQMEFGWSGGDADGMPETIYLTTAIRLSPDDPWLTMMDNYPVYPEKSPDADTHTDRTETTP